MFAVYFSKGTCNSPIDKLGATEDEKCPEYAKSNYVLAGEQGSGSLGNFFHL